MWHLIKSEFLRFRRLALGFAVAHLLVLRGVSAFGDLFTPSLPKVGIGLLVYGAAGLIFGLYQMGTYKKLNQWTYLIHRPLSPKRIFLALAAAAALWFAVVLVLPQGLMTLYADGLTPQGVDLRHYRLIPFLFGTTFSFYLAGCFIALSSSRGAFLVAFLPCFFLTRHAVGNWIFLAQMVVILWLGYLAYVAFKPDLSTPFRRPLAVAAAALPMQYALFWILVMGSAVAHQTAVVIQEEGWGGFATHRWDDHFAEGTYDNAQYLRDGEGLIQGLKAVDTPRNQHLRKQIELAEVLSVSPRRGNFATRGQLMFADDRLALVDEKDGVRWSFRHDFMLFEGHDGRSGARVGWLGADGRSDEGGAAASGLRPFGEVPTVVGNRFLLLPQKLYEFNPLRSHLDLRFEVQPPETLATSLTRKATMAVLLTDRALYFFDVRDLRDEEGLLVPMAKVSPPGEIRDLDRIQVAELLDGYLLSFLYGTRSEAGYGPARQVVAELGIDGSYEEVAEQTLEPGWPVPYRYRAFIFSPVLEVGHDLLWSRISPSRVNRVGVQEVSHRGLPGLAFGWALVVALLSAALAAFGTRGRDLSSRGRWAWVLASFCLGLPAGLSLFLLTAPKEEAKFSAAGFSWLPWSWKAAS